VIPEPRLPPILRLYGRRVRPSWRRRARRLVRGAEVCWNPILKRWCLVKASSGAFLEFDGRGFPGWHYVATIERGDGRPCGLDDRWCAEYRRVAAEQPRHKTRLDRQRWQRNLMREAQRRRVQSIRKVAREASRDMMGDIGPALRGRVSVSMTDAGRGFRRAKGRSAEGAA
jgi:hypothetical protein